MEKRSRDAPLVNYTITTHRRLIMAHDNSAVAIYEQHTGAEEAVRALQKAGFDVKKLSIVGKGYHSEEQVVGFFTTGDRVKFWGGTGGLWGGLWGLVVGAAFLSIPGIGPVLVGGPLVGAIVSAVEGAVVVGGLSAIGAALYSVGIPKDSVVRYEAALKADKYLVVLHGSADEVAKAREILKSSKATSVNEHPAQAAAAR